MSWNAQFEYNPEGPGEPVYQRSRSGPGEQGDAVARVGWDRRVVPGQDTNDITATELRAWGLPLLAAIEDMMATADKQEPGHRRVQELGARARHCIEEGVMLAIKGVYARQWRPEKYSRVTLVDGQDAA